MRNYLIALFILMVCTGCPYESPVPISQQGEAFFDELIGKWQRKEESQNYYLVDALDKKNYKIVENAYNDETESFEVTLYKGHITKIKNNYFFNITQYKANETPAASDEIMISAAPTFYLYKIDVKDNGTFTLQPLSNYIKEEFEKSKDLESFVEEHMHLSFFYGEEEVFIKSEE